MTGDEYVSKDIIWSFNTQQIGEVLLKHAVDEIEHGMRTEADFPTDRNLEQNVVGRKALWLS